jgi:hypothetical protein
MKGGSNLRYLTRCLYISDGFGKSLPRGIRFNCDLTWRLYPSSRAFNQFSVRTGFDKLHKGGLLRLLRYFMPRGWKKYTLVLTSTAPSRWLF